MNWNELIPQIEIGNKTYEDLKSESRMIDKYLGFDFQSIEQNLRSRKVENVENWAHIDAQGFQTPYSEVRFILEQLVLTPQNRILDIGAAYGRLMIVHQLLKFEGEAFGIELESERVAEAKRVFKKWHLIENIIWSDVFKEQNQFSQYDHFFCYDFSSEKEICEMLGLLRIRAQENSIKVVARGGRIRNEIHKHHPWLFEVEKPTHFSRFSIYKS